MVGRVQGSLVLHPASSLPHYFLHTPKRWGKFSAIAKIFLKAPTSYFSSFILPPSQHHIHHLRVYHEPSCLLIAFVWTPLQYPRNIQEGNFHPASSLSIISFSHSFLAILNSTISEISSEPFEKLIEQNGLVLFINHHHKEVDIKYMAFILMQNNSIQQETLSWLIQNISNQIWVQRATVAKVVTINFAQKLFPSYIYFWSCQSQSFNLKHQWMSNIVAKLQLQFLSIYDMTLGAGPPDKTIWAIESCFQIILFISGTRWHDICRYFGTRLIVLALKSLPD